MREMQSRNLVAFSFEIIFPDLSIELAKKEIGCIFSYRVNNLQRIRELQFQNIALVHEFPH